MNPRQSRTNLCGWTLGIALVFCNDTATIRRSVSAERPRRTISSKFDAVTTLQLSNDGRTLLIGGYQESNPRPQRSSAIFDSGQLATINVDGSQETHRIDTHAAPARMFPCSDGTTFVIHCYDASVYTFSNVDAKLSHLVAIEANELAYCSRSSEAVCSSIELGVCIWRFEPISADVRRIVTLKRHVANRCAPVAISSDGSKVAFAEFKDAKRRNDITLTVLRRDNIDVSVLHWQYDGCIGPIQFSPNGRSIAVAEPGNDISLLDLVSGKRIWTLSSMKARHSGIIDLSFGKDGKYLVATMYGGVRTVEVATGKVVREYDYVGPTATVIIPDKNVLAIAGNRGGAESTIDFWELSD